MIGYDRHRRRAILDEVQPHWVGAAATVLAAIIGAASSASSASSARRSSAAGDLAGLQGASASKPPYEPTSQSAGRILPNLPQGTTLNQAMGYDQTRRSGEPGATGPDAFSSEPNMSTPAPSVPAGGSMPPPQPGAYGVAGTQPSSSYNMGNVPGGREAGYGGQGDAGLSTDQYVQLGRLGLQAAQAFSRPGQPSPMPQPGAPTQYQPTAYQAMQRRRF